jgi:hypothetical protein
MCGGLDVLRLSLQTLVFVVRVAIAPGRHVVWSIIIIIIIIIMYLM